MKFHWVSKLLFSVLIWPMVGAKVTIFAHYFGQPEFIKYQYSLFKKNMRDEYEFIVVEDSNNDAISHAIKNECKKFGIKYIHIPRGVFERSKFPDIDSYVGGPSFECSVAIQFIYDKWIVNSKNICLIMDNDIFLISPFSIEKYLESNSFAYVYQQKGTTDYMLPNFLILNPSKMAEKQSLNFFMGTINGDNTDSGGYTHFYLGKYREFGKRIPVHYLYNTSTPLKETFAERCPILFTSESWAPHYFIDKEAFLHIRMGSNWSNDVNYPKMISEVSFLLDHLIQNTQ